MRIRFRLRSLLVLFLMLALTIGIWTNAIRSQRGTVAEIERLGGIVLNVHPDSTLFHGTVYPSWVPKSLHQFWLMNINSIQLCGNHVEDKDVEKILRLRNIIAIDLSESCITDKSLKDLQQAYNLTHLVLLDVDTISEAGVTEFQLNVPDCHISR